MTKISTSNIKRFLAVAGLTLAIPMAIAASPAGPREGRGSGDCSAMEGQGRHGRHGGEMGMHGMMGPHYLRGLNLTEAQRDKVFEIKHAQEPAMRDKAKAMHNSREELRTLGASPDYSDAKAQALADASAKAMAEMTLMRLRTDRQIYDVLTPEQRTQLAEMKPPAERGHRMHGERRQGSPAR